MEIIKTVKPNTDQKVHFIGYIPKAVKGAIVPSKPVMLILPGGSYAFCSDREAEPVALRFCGKGYASFVLTYSVGKDARFPNSLLDVMWAIKTIRENAAEWQLDPEKICVCGFSAGANLAAAISVFWNREDFATQAGATCSDVRPNAAIVCYPVTSAKLEYTCTSMFENQLQEKALDEQARKAAAPDEHVHALVPPCFLWHTASDCVAPVQNSLLFALELAKFHVPFEIHVYPCGVHGLSLADKTTATCSEQIEGDVANWSALALSWLDKVFYASSV